MALLPMAMYGLEVPPGDVAIMAHADIPAGFRITMAAIDPSAEPEGDPDEVAHPRATLKVLRLPLGDDYDDDDSEDEMDIEDMDAQFGESDDDSSEDEEEVNGGPSDPAKSKKARREAAREEIKKLLESEGMDLDEDEDEDVEDDGAVPNGINGVVKSKRALGKMPKGDEDSDEEIDSDLDDEDIGGEIEEFVLCTLDPTKSYQQPLDLTFGEDERVWFKVSGTHTIYLTGNYVEPLDGNQDMFDPDSDEEDEYDLSPDEDELEDSEDESIDELDDIDDPRIMELEDDLDAPALVKVTKKVAEKPVANKNKRAAPDSADEDEAEAGAETIDDLIAAEAVAAASAEQKLSKKQQKKLKKNNGDAGTPPIIAKVAEAKVDTENPSSNKSDKKVSFAAQLEQGPTPTKDSKAGDKKDGKAKPALGVKTVQGVSIDDRKLGSGQAAKNGDRVGMRYIGKLKDGKVFDQNKSGKPFTFKLGSGEVIKGWDIGIAGMQAGGERRIVIPAHLAYGSKKLPGIPANSPLTFDIKMLDINKGK